MIYTLTKRQQDTCDVFYNTRQEPRSFKGTLDNKIGLIARTALRFTTDSMDLAIGLLSVVPSLLSKRVADFTFEQLDVSSGILFRLYLNLISIVNAQFEYDVIKSKDGDVELREEDLTGEYMSYSCSLIESFTDKIIEMTNSPNFFKRHVSCRLGFAVNIVASIVITIVEVPLGIVAAAFSLLLLGKWERLNKFALTRLNSLDYIAFSYVCIQSLLAPSRAQEFFYGNKN